MGVVRSGNADGSAAYERAVAKLKEIDAQDFNRLKDSALSVMCSGADAQIYADAGTSRTNLYGSWLMSEEGTSLVVCGATENAHSICQALAALGAKVRIGADVDGIRESFSQGAGIIVVPVALANQTFKGSGQLPVNRCVIDGVGSIIESVGLPDLESFLLAFREGHSDTQLVLIAQEPSLHMSALSRRFLTEPKTCSVKSSMEQDMEHFYFEVGTALLAKPQALCDLIELESSHPCIVFCNSPSDADFADVILKKRGISSVKLIGYVPQLKLTKAIGQIQRKEVSVLVITDVAARGVPLEDFGVVVNYSVPSDPEVYFHRYTAEPGSRTKKVISLVAPLDIANFHYLKKLGKLEFRKAELPSAEELFMSKFAQLKEHAIEKQLLNEPSVVTLVDKVMGDENAREIVSLLLHNTVSVIPALKAAATPREDVSERSDEEEEDSGRRSGGRRSQGNNRGDRNGGRNRRNAGGDGEYEGDFGYEEEDRFRGQSRRHGRNSRDSGSHDGENGNGGRPQRPQRKPVVVDKEARLYVGAGTRGGLSAERVVGDIVKVCGVAQEDVHRVSVRDCYTFVDVADAIADQVIDSLGETDCGSTGDKYFVKKAVTLSIPRPGVVEESESENRDDVELSSDMDVDSDGEGPTLLAVDDTL